MKRALTDAVSVEGEAIVAFLAAECVAQQFVFDHVAERRCVRAKRERERDYNALASQQV